MSVVVSCPNCATRLKANESMEGKSVKCPKCGQRFIAPSSVPAPVPVPVPTKEVSQSAVSPPQQPRNHPEGALLPAPAPANVVAQPGSPQSLPSNPEGAVLGTIGLILGIVSAVCVLIGCITCGLFLPAYFVAIPVSLTGVGCSAFGRGKYRTAGLVINSVALFLAIVFPLLMFLGLIAEMSGHVDKTWEDGNDSPRKTPARVVAPKK